MTQPFGPRSLALLSQAHPSLRVLFTRVNTLYQCTVVAGARTVEEEQAEIDKGLSHLKKPRDSKHVIQADGFCHALDVCPDPIDSNWSRDYENKLRHFGGFVQGIAYWAGIQIRYGGDPRTSFNWDLDHFELEG